MPLQSPLRKPASCGGRWRGRRRGGLLRGPAAGENRRRRGRHATNHVTPFRAPASQIRPQGGGQQFLGILARVAAAGLARGTAPTSSAPRCRPQPWQRIAAPVVSRRARNASCRSTSRIGDRRAAFGGQRPLTFQAAGLEPGERHVDHRSSGAAPPRQHVLADGAAVRTNHAVGDERLLDRAVEQKSATIIDIAVAAVGIGYARMRPSRGTADGRRTSCNDCRRCDRRDSNLIDTPTHRM